MAKGLENYTNIEAATPAYLKGRVKNDTGVGDGTPWDQFTFDDTFQFFVKLLASAGITANGIPENETNGYQYLDAVDFRTVYKNVTKNRFTRYRFSDNPFTTIAGIYSYFQFPAITSEFDLTSAPSENVVSFGDVLDKGVPFHFILISGSAAPIIVLNSTNAGSLPTITKSGIGGANTLYTIPTDTIITVIRMTSSWLIKD